MHDLVDIHRAAIAKAGVTLAEAIAEATAAYSASVAASEAALQVAMDRRIEAFHGTGLAQAQAGAPRPLLTDVDGNVVATSDEEILPGPDARFVLKDGRAGG